MMDCKNIMEKPCHVYFMGIGGISMSGLAEILLDKGYKVSGSDIKQTEVTNLLEEKGAHINYSQVGENITDDIDFAVYTAAIRENNEEYIMVKEKNIPSMTRAMLLGYIMEQYKNAISVSGTHGKTTTTSMISEIMLASACDPTILVGGMLNSIGGNYKIGHSDYIITEACEYTNSFLSLISNVNVILNVKEDHLDFFKDIDDIRHSFKVFADKLDENGNLIINNEIDDVDYFTKDLKAKCTTFGIDVKSDYSAKNIKYNAFACAEFDVTYKDEIINHICLKVPGHHNVLNALAAYATGKVLNFSDDIIKKGLENYGGTDRRFQFKGSFNGVNVVDDYAHHPDEIKATLEAVKNYPHKNLYLVFQPHTYTRTLSLMEEFADALKDVNNLILAKIYPARETDDLGISSQTLCDRINEKNGNAIYLDTFEEIEKYLINNCKEGDLLITMGAGNVVEIGEKLVK